MERVNVGLIGFGTVGAGTYEVLMTNAALISRRVGCDVVVRRIADLDIDSDRGVPVDRALLTREAMDVLQDPEIHVVVELMGGISKAKEYILKAMSLGKHVVTANKALLAECGREIYAAAERHRVSLGFEASVGGGIPVIGALRSGLAANRIETIMGILNGTSNYILTRMTHDGHPYEKAVEEAVRLGYAEDPPTLDVNGTDAAHKLAILTSIAFGTPIPLEAIYREGIESLTPEDIRYAGDFGYTVKLLAIARDTAGTVEARVHPAMIPQDHILANVNGVYNAIYFEGDFVGPNLYYGLGAGRRPTGSAVVSDILHLARLLRMGQRTYMPPLGHRIERPEPLAIRGIDALTTAYYFRVSALDQPGVLSKISGVLGEHGISIASVIQKGRVLRGSVPIVMMTHEARESHVRKALARLETLEVLTDRTVSIRVEGSAKDLE